MIIEKITALIKKFATLLKFMSSGVICFLIDQGLFNLFDHVILADADDWWRVFFATLISRIISSFINFTLNRKVVFASKENYAATMVKYYILCALQLCASAGLAYFFSWASGINETFTKLVADGLLFIVSYNIQRKFIFKPETTNINAGAETADINAGTKTADNNSVETEDINSEEVKYN